MAVLRWCALLAMLVPVAPLAPAVPRPRLSERYDRWLNQEVVYLISDAERKDFLKLQTDAERDKFIEEFWDVRNPVRGARENPFKAEHYRRLEYANANFGRETGTPGWKTDMGRTWILFGKPASRASFKGYGQIYPLDLWFYSNNTGNPSLPSFFYVLFFIPEDIGDYRYYRPTIDGPMKLVRGSQFNTPRDVYNFLKPLGGDVARAALSLIPSEPLDLQEYSPSIASDMLVSKVQNLANDSFNLERLREARYLRARVKSWFLVPQERPLDVEAAAFTDPDGQTWLDYAVLIADQNLGRPDPSGSGLMVEVGFRLRTQAGELIVDDSEERSYNAFDTSTGQKKFQPFLVANRIPLVAGKYRLEVEVTNREAGRSYRGERQIEVAASGGYAVAGPLLASAVAPAATPDPDTPFQYFGVQFQPAPCRRVAKQNPLRILYQLQVPPEGSRNYDVEYVVAHVQDRASRRTVSDRVEAAAFREGRLLKAKTVALGDLEPGDYRVVVTARAEGSAQALASATAPLEIADEGVQPNLYFLSNFRTVARTGVAPYVRALESLAQKNEDRAAEYLVQALDKDPSNPFVKRLLVQLYFNAGKSGAVIGLYRKLGIAAFESPESVAQIVLSFWHAGDGDGARRVLASAETLFPRDPVLASAADKIGPAVRPR